MSLRLTGSKAHSLWHINQLSLLILSVRKYIYGHMLIDLKNIESLV